MQSTQIIQSRDELSFLPLGRLRRETKEVNPVSIQGPAAKTTGTSTRPAWADVVEQLCEFLQRGERQLNLLNLIDREVRTVLDGNKPLDYLLEQTVDKLVELTRADAGHFFLRFGETSIRLHTTRPNHPPSNDDLERLLASHPMWDQDGFIDVEGPELTGLSTLSNARGLLLSRIDIHDTDYAGILILESHEPIQVGKFQVGRFFDPTTRGFVTAVTSQLSNALRFYAGWRERIVEGDILRAFFGGPTLKPSKCLAELARQVPRLLLDIGPLAITPLPDVQILFLSKNGKYLTIRATTGEEQDITRVKVADSACGYLVEDPSLPYYLCDPRKERRYKSYLGRSEDAPKEMRTELAVPIREANMPMAILNFESEHENAFPPPQIDAALQCAKIAAPWIRALWDRLETGWSKELAMDSVMGGYVLGNTRLLAHNAGNAAARLAASLELAQMFLPSDNPEVSTRLQSAQLTAREIGQMLSKFSRDVDDSATFGKQRIMPILEDAVRRARDLHDVELRDRITIRGPEGKDCDVYCSKMLGQHIYEVLSNSVFWLNRRLENQADPRGEITIRVEQRREGKEHQERDLNTRCVIRIRDNGKGVSQETLRRLRDFPRGYTERRDQGGTGYGLFALRQYLDSIGGWAALDSEENKFFEVTISVDVYDSEVHAAAP